MYFISAGLTLQSSKYYRKNRGGGGEREGGRKGGREACALRDPNSSSLP